MLLQTVLDKMLPGLHDRLMAPIAALLRQLGYRQAVLFPLADYPCFPCTLWYWINSRSVSSPLPPP